MITERIRIDCRQVSQLDGKRGHVVGEERGYLLVLVEGVSTPDVVAQGRGDVVILRKPDGITLYYTTQEGVEVSANPINWQLFTQLQTTLDAQNAAVQANTQAQSKYLSDLHDYQVMLDTKGQAAAGLRPLKPVYKTVTDTGSVLLSGFVGLPDPVYPVATPSAPIGPDARTAPLDPATAMLLSTLMALHAKVDRLLSKAGA